MKIRELKKEDAPLMLEWMKDDYVVHYLATDFSDKKINDCEAFIDEAIKQYSEEGTCRSIHMAIADDNDEYMGTVSLKNINRDSGSAEFAITVRRTAMQQGYAEYGMNEILKMGFDDPDFGLLNIYWCVNSKNERARKFYDKHSFPMIEPSDDMVRAYKDKIGEAELIWYQVTKEDRHE